MTRWIVGTTATLALLSLNTTASAQNFGDKGTFVFGADRVMGFVHSRLNVDPDGEPDITTKRNNFGFIIQGDVVSPYSNPRVAFDYFVIRRLTIGGTLGYWSQGGEFERDGPGGDGDLEDRNLFTIAPRVGYGLMFGSVVGIWPRGGFTFHTGDFLGDDTAGFGMNLDVPFVFVPFPHFAILAGPGLDFTIAGGGERASGVDYSARFFDIGLHVGFVGYI